MFTVSATSASSQPVTVLYSTGGTASLGSDYTLDGTLGQVVIPAGQSSADIHMHTVPGSVPGKGKTVKLQLNANGGYKMPRRGGKSATIKIVH